MPLTPGGKCDCGYGKRGGPDANHAAWCAAQPILTIGEDPIPPDPKGHTMWSRLRSRVAQAVHGTSTFYPSPEEWMLLEQAMALVEDMGKPTVLDDLPWKALADDAADTQAVFERATAQPVNWRDLREGDEVEIVVRGRVQGPGSMLNSLGIRHNGMNGGSWWTWPAEVLERCTITCRERPLAVGDRVRFNEHHANLIGLRLEKRSKGSLAHIIGDQAWVSWQTSPDGVHRLTDLERVS